jgi:TfoX/Sxy family transcriptional regulator of competence genes
MPYDEILADRVEALLKNKRSVTEKKMFGGLCFMVNGNMACGVEKNKLVVRVGPGNYEKILKQKYVRKMDFTGKPLKGFIYVMPEGLRRTDSLQKWIDKGIQFARSLPKK